MRASHRTLIAAAGAACVLAACQTDPISGPSKIVGDPLLDMVLGPAGNSAFPVVSGARITTAAARDTIEFTVNNLPPTGAGVTYQLALVDTATGNMTAPSARIIRTMRSRRPVNRDSSVAMIKADTATAAQFAISDTATTASIRIASTAIPSYTHVLLRASGQGAVPATIGAGRNGFLSFRYKSGAAYAVQASMFGSFAQASANRLPFSVSAYVVNATFWGEQIRLSFRNLIRPPAGFRYAAWLVDERTGTATRVGGILSPVPENAPLDDADLGSGKWYNDVGILESQVRGDMKALNVEPQNYTFLALVLEPYGGTAPPARPGVAYVLSASIPNSVASRSATPGKIFGTVTSASGKSLLNTTVYLQGINMTVPGQVGSATATGTWQFRAVPTGTYKVYAIPFGDAVIRDSATVTLGSKPVNNVLTGDSLFVTLRIP
ncbi:MAG: carboxypeptidase-like regulatory domain-containing protein [Gemmatimonadaceae bacterium]